MTAPETTHLWEYDHPYYCSESNFHKPPADRHLRWASWSEFVTDGWGGSDHDMNLLFRWDWIKPNPEDYETGDEGVAEIPNDTLLLFFMLQRKGDFWAHSVAVTNEDEPAIREWLTERAKTITAIWAPILAGGAATEAEEAATS